VKQVEVWVGLGEVADEPVDQSGPPADGDFTYIDIGCVDRERKVISAPQILAAESAPSRARQRLQVGDVLVSMTRPNLNAVAIIPDSLNGAIGTTGFHVLRSRWMQAKYLYFLVQSQEFVDAMCSVVQGALYPAVRPGDIGAFMLRVPPLPEQNRIIDKLEELLSDLDAAVAELKTAQKKLAQYRQSLLKAAVEGQLTANWRERNDELEESGAQLLKRSLRERRLHWERRQLAKFEEQGKEPPQGWKGAYREHLPANTQDLPELPIGWAWASLDMLGEIASGVAKGSKQDERNVLREVPYLRVANVQRGYLDLTEVKTILATERDIRELALQDGDVLFNEGGDRDKLGRGWVWRGAVSPCIHQNHVFRMRPYLKDLHPEFISHHGNTFGKLWFQTAGKQTTNLASINMGMLREFPVPVPPAAEQREIASALDAALTSIADQAATVNRALRQAAAQRKNILQAAFSGQLVPQDPNDEPASVLLERIRAKRAAQGEEGKRGRSPAKKSKAPA